MERIEREEVYDLLCDCGLYEVLDGDFGTTNVMDEDTIMDEFIPELLNIINDKFDFNLRMV